MSRMLFLCTPNLFHANVTAKDRRRLINEALEWFRALQSLPVPVVTGLATLDHILLTHVHGSEMMEGVLAGLHHYATSWNHALLSLLPARTPGFEHARWLVEHGPCGNTDLVFYPEYDVPASEALLRRRKVIPVLPDRHACLYSECAVDGVQRVGKLDGQRAIRSGHSVIVPMWGVDAVQSAFFAWQRFPFAAEREEALVAAIRAIGEANDDDDVRIFFMDMEAPLVGSYYGLEVWNMFGELLCKHGLTDLFVGPQEACATWRKWADAHPIEGSVRPLIARDLGGKWTRFAPQIAHMARVAMCNAPTQIEQIWLSIASGSDALVSLQVGLEGGVVRTLEADRGPITIGADPTMIQIAKAALEPDRAHVYLKNAHPDGRWFWELLCASFPR